MKQISFKHFSNLFQGFIKKEYMSISYDKSLIDIEFRLST